MCEGTIFSPELFKKPFGVDAEGSVVVSCFLGTLVGLVDVIVEESLSGFFLRFCEGKKRGYELGGVARAPMLSSRTHALLVYLVSCRRSNSESLNSFGGIGLLPVIDLMILWI